MLFSEIIETVLLDIDENLSDVEVVTKVKNYINRGYMDLAKKERLCDTVNATIVEGRLRKPMDSLKILSVSINEVPVKWYTEDDYIFVEGDGRCKVLYQYLPEKLVDDTDETETNELNIDYIINYAIWKYFTNEDGLEEKAKLYKVELEGMKLITNQDGFRQIIDVYGVV